MKAEGGQPHKNGNDFQNFAPVIIGGDLAPSLGEGKQNNFSDQISECPFFLAQKFLMTLF